MRNRFSVPLVTLAFIVVVVVFVFVAASSANGRRDSFNMDTVRCRHLVVQSDDGEPSMTVTAQKDGVYLFLSGPPGQPSVGIYQSKDQGAVIGLWSKAPGGTGMDFCVSTQGDDVIVQSVDGKNIKVVKAKKLISDGR